jgi:hypothetical protein
MIVIIITYEVVQNRAAVVFGEGFGTFGKKE